MRSDRVTPSVIACALALATTSACGSREALEKAATPTISVSVQLARVETLKNMLVSTGVVVPAAATDWTIAAPEPARIAELPKAEGESVAVGDLLVRFDIASISAELASKQVDLADAMTRLENSKVEVAKLSGLFDQGLLPRNQLDAAKNRLAQAESAVKRVKSELDSVALLQEHAVIRARFPGVIARRWHKQGDLVEGTQSDPVLRVIDPTHVQVALQVPASQLGRAIPGMPASVLTQPGGPPEPATIVLRNAVEPGATSAEVRVALVNPVVIPMDTPVQVEILLEQRTDAIVVPRAALVYERDRPSVFVAGSDNRAYRREVRVGLIVQNLAEILSGVKAGEQVITTGLDELSDGALISTGR